MFPVNVSLFSHLKKHYCGNIMFPIFLCLSTSGNIDAETKFAYQKAKVFPNKSRNIFVADTMFSRRNSVQDVYFKIRVS